ncbi:glycosyltransferase [Peribacillus sp. ACCC06369]|uniref:CgeB family protein n=1 Tax=Peribacillus sp. ACCC06369 TaxID=3055860 RepID=UPI0025A2C5D0|nr:glycosyltransferase [Peribacillus sp. ACCC06369]MDM5356499.1 glycosyltransferase [Peribacillus sp. ACCC06369]
MVKDEIGLNDRFDFWNKSVLYVHSRHGDTYTIINQGIIKELRNLVREVYTAKAEQDVVSLAAEFRPDLVLVLLGDTFPIDQVNAIREMGIKTAVWFTDDPYYTDVMTNIAPHYHYVFTQELSCVSYYQLLGCPQVHYLPLAVNTKIFHYQRERKDNFIDVCFMGAGWNNRISLFDEIAPFLSKKNTLIVGSRWDRMRNYHLLSDKIHFGFLSPSASARLMNQSKIVINNHRLYDDTTLFNRNSNKLPALSINPRTFEISACGAFQLSDIRQELPRYYEIGKEIETYTSPSELTEKIDYYLNHDEERNTIAQSGYIQTLKSHTYAKRLATLLKLIYG